MNNRFEDKVVLITGAGSGLGQASALQVAKEGAKLGLVDVKKEGLEATEKLIREAVPEAEPTLSYSRRCKRRRRKEICQSNCG